ncbi:uncharacterized protein OCT59_019903 [Rhizophagus irregularis]|uniref:Uncharacterized protein n=1 Tax=Rhizophagus irregularis (strain DAOM 197198w) TaxID=1432141 RepID=A0A015NEQ6_RHIIW|nr:hypothetical protein RirG_020630 [Rhizophagus irregularis DAOM 197198w]UZO27714.1 hypothetical protein OCT59_019903 [Rhizophagus irregularis]GBC25458.1 hypothetical protein GLOIN_2v1478529 [Rhizophagus irregularis DAOM 181602=DAOM 197198]
MRPEVLNQFAPELLKRLTERKKRIQARQRLWNGYNFNDEQVTALIPFQKGGRSKVESCLILLLPSRNGIGGGTVNDNLNETEVKALSKALVESATSATSASSRLSRLQRELHKLDIPEKIISATLDPETTRLANEEQKKKILLRENEGIDYPEHLH